MHNYELFKMDPNETISTMFTRFTDITNGLKSLDKIYSNVDLVQKILRSLSDKWDPKVTAIQEAKDLNTLSLDELMGSLITHELIMQHRNEDDKKRRKIIAFKAAMDKMEKSEEEHSSGNEIQDDDLAMIVRKFKKFMKRKRRFNRKFIKKGEISRDKKKEKDKEKDQGPVCYECKKSGHLRYDCPLLNSSLRKKMKKALFGAWTDNEDSSSSSNEEETTNTVNLCLMALEDEDV